MIRTTLHKKPAISIDTITGPKQPPGFAEITPFIPTQDHFLFKCSKSKAQKDVTCTPQNANNPHTKSFTIPSVLLLELLRAEDPSTFGDLYFMRIPLGANQNPNTPYAIACYTIGKQSKKANVRFVSPIIDPYKLQIFQANHQTQHPCESLLQYALWSAIFYTQQLPQETLLYRPVTDLSDSTSAITAMHQALHFWGIEQIIAVIAYLKQRRLRRGLKVKPREEIIVPFANNIHSSTPNIAAFGIEIYHFQQNFVPSNPQPAQQRGISKAIHPTPLVYTVSNQPKQDLYYITDIAQQALHRFPTITTRKKQIRPQSIYVIALQTKGGRKNSGVPRQILLFIGHYSTPHPLYVTSEPIIHTGQRQVADLIQMPHSARIVLAVENAKGPTPSVLIP